MAATKGRRTAERGQALVVMVAMMLLATSLLGLIVDGGNVLTHERFVQAGSDATSEAGAVVLGGRLAGAVEPAGGWDAAVLRRVREVADTNGITVRAAYYTDICGIPLASDGSAALDGTGAEDLSRAMRVGSGGLPGGTATMPDCPSRIQGPVAGVLVLADRNVRAYVAGAVGIPSFTVSTRATAVSGYLQGYCDASQGQACDVMPLTIPGYLPTCDGSGKLGSAGAAWLSGVVYKIGLCSNDPGNVGWLDWTPPAGGATELVCSIVNPDNPAVNIPSWLFVSQAGNVNGGGSCTDADTGITYSGVEDAFRKYDGRIILIPQFSPPNCNPGPGQTPNSAQVQQAPNYGCKPPDQNASGQNQWYRITSFAFLKMCSPSDPDCGGLHGAYLQGDNTAICGQGNGQTGCLVAKLVDIMASGTVAAGAGSGTGTKAIGVQLIK